MKTFKHLDQHDRDRIHILLEDGVLQKDIAKTLGVDPSTISREIQYRKKSDGVYDSNSAHHKAYFKRKYSKYQGMKVASCLELEHYVIENLKQKRSPDEIAGRMKLEQQPFYASKDAIYQWLYSAQGQKYCKFLCTKKYKRKKQKKTKKREMIPNALSIHDRPLGATNKTRYGHFEADTVVAPKKVSNNEAIAITIERKSKFILATKIHSLSIRNMNKAIFKFKTLVTMKTVTLDRGIENRGHQDWIVPTYFADPHSPWQKPMVENNIGLLRKWFFKKGTDWSKISEKQLQDAVNTINNKYRKSLGYKSAVEVSQKCATIKNDPTKNCI